MAIDPETDIARGGLQPSITTRLEEIAFQSAPCATMLVELLEAPDS